MAYVERGLIIIRALNYLSQREEGVFYVPQVWGGFRGRVLLLLFLLYFKQCYGCGWLSTCLSLSTCWRIKYGLVLGYSKPQAIFYFFGGTYEVDTGFNRKNLLRIVTGSCYTYIVLSIYAGVAELSTSRDTRSIGVFTTALVGIVL